MHIRIALTAACLLAAAPFVLEAARNHGKGGFEVWIADQSDTRPGFGGQLVIYEGSDLMGKKAARATPIARLDLGAETSDLCRTATGRNPVRPHMISFNSEHTHAVLSFVASGHVVIFDAEARKPLNCFETTVGTTKTRQAHAAFPAPDGSYILVANQNGKRLERIDTNFTTNTFAHNAAATLDLMTCTTPNGQPCEHPDLRPINWPICPIIDSTQPVWVRHAARRRPLRRRRQGDADGHRRRVRQDDGERQRMRRSRGGASHVHQLRRQPGERLVRPIRTIRRCTGSTSIGSRSAGIRRRTWPTRRRRSCSSRRPGCPTRTASCRRHNDRYLWVMDRHANVAEIIEVPRASG